MIWALRLLAVFLIAAVLGLYALSEVFSDLGPGETALRRGVVTGGVLLVGGAAIGMLQAKRWWISIGVAWGPMLVGAMVLAARWRGAVQSASPRFAMLCLLAAPAVALVGGFLGSRLVRRRPPVPPADSGLPGD